MSTTEPLVKAAMLYLGEIWPQSVSFATLFAVAQSQLHREAVVVDTSHATADTSRLAEPLLRCYGTSHVELSVYAPNFTMEGPERPLASRVARHQAASGNQVTNLRHERSSLNDVQRRMLPYLDGKHDLEALTDVLVSQVGEGLLTVHDQGRPRAGSYPPAADTVRVPRPESKNLGPDGTACGRVANPSFRHPILLISTLASYYVAVIRSNA